jgi:hypothetical protein
MIRAIDARRAHVGSGHGPWQLQDDGTSLTALMQEPQARG